MDLPIRASASATVLSPNHATISSRFTVLTSIFSVGEVSRAGATTCGHRPRERFQPSPGAFGSGLAIRVPQRNRCGLSPCWMTQQAHSNTSSNYRCTNVNSFVVGPDPGGGASLRRGLSALCGKSWVSPGRRELGSLARYAVGTPQEIRQPTTPTQLDAATCGLVLPTQPTDTNGQNVVCALLRRVNRLAVSRWESPALRRAPWCATEARSRGSGRAGCRATCAASAGARPGRATR
jgi:hypothetical protein